MSKILDTIKKSQVLGTLALCTIFTTTWICNYFKVNSWGKKNPWHTHLMPLPGPNTLSHPYSPNLTNEWGRKRSNCLSTRSSKKVGVTSESIGATSETHSWVSIMFEGEKHTNIYWIRKTNLTQFSNSMLGTHGKYLHRLNLTTSCTSLSKSAIGRNELHSPTWTRTLWVLTCVVKKLPFLGVLEF